MKNKQEIPAVIVADAKVFDYLKEKVGERKTRTEAYCDLLDKSLGSGRLLGNKEWCPSVRR